MFAGLAQKWPWWNLTLGRRRHLLLSPCDHGPGDCMYSRQLYLTPCSPAVPKEINPKHPQRELVFLMASGAPQHWTFFGVASTCGCRRTTRTSAAPFVG